MILVFLLIEFIDEFVFGAREAAWPLIRNDLNLTYVQIGLLLSVPGLISSLIEPMIAVLSDIWDRRKLILIGGVAFTIELALIATGQTFAALMIAFCIIYPASGAFVSLSQATLMDREPDRHEQNMARWTFAGSVGVVGGPLALGAAVALGIGWRGTFLAMAAMSAVLVAAFYFTREKPHQAAGGKSEEEPLTLSRFGTAMKDAVLTLRNSEVRRWLILLVFSDLMLDILLGYLALYFVDVVKVDEVQAGIAVAVWTGVGLLGDFLMIHLLERVRGLTYLRITAAVMLVLFPAFMLLPGFILKLVVLALMGLFNAGWYAILQGRLYSELPGRSGAALAVTNITGLGIAFLPLVIGLLAQQAGLGIAMWILIAGPVALLIGIPRRVADHLPDEASPD